MHLKANFFLKIFFLFISVAFVFSFIHILFFNSSEPIENNLSINPNFEFNETIPDEIESFCSGLNFNFYNNLSFSDVDNIEIVFSDREKWFTNLFYLSLNEGRVIDSSYKDVHQAYIEISYKNKYKCKFKSEIRVSGDWNDHLDKINLVASMDVKLLDGNILGITKFKLFLPETRNSDNEIFVTVLLEELGFLSPRSFYINVGFNNHNNDKTNYKFIFQEKLSKEMVEANGFREAPLLETNESFYWSEVINNTLDLNKGFPLMFAKSLNSYWAKKGTSQSIITIEGLELFNKSIFNSYNPYTQLDYSQLGEDQNMFYMFDAANIALLAEHGITNHQRKFLYNKLNNQFYPVYYDGNSNFIELGHIRWRNDYEEKENLSKGAKNLLETTNLNAEIINKKLNDRGLIYDLETSKTLINKFLNNLKIISNQETNIKPDYKNSIENINKTNFPKSFKLVFVDINKNKYEFCSSNLVDCKSLDISEGSEYIYSNKIKINDTDGYIFGTSKESLRTPQNNRFDNNFIYIDDSKLEVFGSPEITINRLDKTLDVVLFNNNQKIKISGPGSLNNWKIKITSTFVKSESDERLDENLLTGCLTLYDLNISNLDINLENLNCEDSLNIIRSSGSIENLVIMNAYSDGLDIDYSNITLKNLFINNSLNDCLDLSAGKYKVENFKAQNCKDKAISVGEKATVDFNIVEVINSNIGIAVKDSSQATINSSVFEKVNLCYAIYRKKQEFGPSILRIEDLICKSENSNFVQNGSEVSIGN